MTLKPNQKCKNKSALFREAIESQKRTLLIKRFREIQPYGARTAPEARLLNEEDIERLALRGR